MTASCDTCRRPGSCCRGFVLSLPAVDPEGWREASLEQVAARGIDYFEPMYASASMAYEGKVRAVWSCRRLTPEGRCGDYENRPPPCHAYQPGEDALCAEFVHTFKGIPLTWSHA